MTWFFQVKNADLASVSLFSKSQKIRGLAKLLGRGTLIVAVLMYCTAAANYHQGCSRYCFYDPWQVSEILNRAHGVWGYNSLEFVLMLVASALAAQWGFFVIGGVLRGSKWMKATILTWIVLALCFLTLLLFFVLFPRVHMFGISIPIGFNFLLGVILGWAFSGDIKREIAES